MRGTPPLPPWPPLPAPLAGSTTGLPVGTIVAFAGEAVGSLEASEWMVCDGRELPISGFPELFSVIGYRYSPRSGGETFHLPDLRGYFLRGVDEGSGHDPDAGSRKRVDGSTSSAVGSIQDCALQLHEHTYSQPTASAPVQGEGGTGLIAVQSASTLGVVPEEVPTSRLETRPKNVAVYFIIKHTRSTSPAAAPLGRYLPGGH